MADILITGGFLISMNPTRQVIADGAVAIEKDRIIDVGTTQEITSRHQAPKVIDAKGKAILPGLIDAHSHAGHGLVKSMGGGTMDMERWKVVCEVGYSRASTPEFWRAEAQLSALERLRFGVTTGLFFLGGGMMIMRTDDPIYGDAHCDGVVEVGTRSIVGLGPNRPPFPVTYTNWNGDVPTDSQITYERQKATSETLLKRWHGSHGQRISIALLTAVLAPLEYNKLGAAEHDENARHVRGFHALSRDYGVLFTQDGHFGGTIMLAEELGILGPNSLLGQATNLSEEEIRLCAETETRIVHNPSSGWSNWQRCPVPEFIDAGVVVAMGSDASGPDRSKDMFRHMQACMHYHRTHKGEMSWMPPGKVLKMCTIDAARAVGMEKEIGSLEVGKKADIILVNLRRPHIYPNHMLEFHVICFANGNDVDTVIVDGRVALEDGKALFVNEDNILDTAQSEVEKMIARGKLEDYLSIPPKFWGHSRATPPKPHVIAVYPDK